MQVNKEDASLIRQQKRRYLADVMGQAELTAEEKRILEWLCNMQDFVTIKTLVSAFQKATALRT